VVSNHIETTEPSLPNHFDNNEPTIPSAIENEVSESLANQNKEESKEQENLAKVDSLSEEDLLQRPNTLRFLAASAAFQASTVPALKRLPYTPDPGIYFVIISVVKCELYAILLRYA